MISLALLLGALLAQALAPPPAPAEPRQAPPSPDFKRVMIIIFENADPDVALRQPFMARLAHEGAFLARFYAVARPSQPNYIALTAGNVHGVKTNGTVTLDVPHIGDLLEARGKSWKVYAEDYPGNCFLKARYKAYRRRHVPLLNYRSVQERPARCARVVEAARLYEDVAEGALPDYSLFIPNNLHNGHDTSVGYADWWLGRTFGPLVQDPRFTRDMLLVVTFDEDADTKGKRGTDNRIYTALYGPSVRPGSVSETRYDHYSLLRTIQEAFALRTLGQRDAAAIPITGVWRSERPP